VKIDSRSFGDTERYRFHVLKDFIIRDTKNPIPERLDVPSPLSIILDPTLMVFSV